MESPLTVTTTYTVTNMTCDHCVAAVTAELKQLHGVSDVAVDLDSGAVAVTSDEPVDHSAVQAAVEEAGDYHLGS